MLVTLPAIAAAIIAAATTAQAAPLSTRLIQTDLARRSETRVELTERGGGSGAAESIWDALGKCLTCGILKPIEMDEGGSVLAAEMQHASLPAAPHLQRQSSTASTSESFGLRREASSPSFRHLLRDELATPAHTGAHEDASKAHRLSASRKLRDLLREQAATDHEAEEAAAPHQEEQTVPHNQDVISPSGSFRIYLADQPSASAKTLEEKVTDKHL